MLIYDRNKTNIAKQSLINFKKINILKNNLPESFIKIC